MAVIKLKRTASEIGTQTITAGELAIAGTKLYYGRADSGVNQTGLTPTQVAGTNISNLFTGLNIFSGAGQTISIKDSSGNENYGVYNGRLIARYPSGFAFNQNDLVDKSYVDASAQGLVVHASVKVATTANLPGYSANVITFPSAGVWSPSGLTMALNDRILVKDQTIPLQNGIYYISTLGTVAVATVLTRATDMDGDWPTEVYRAYVFVDQDDSSWVTAVNSTGTVGSDSIIWNEFSRVSGIFADEVSLTKTSNVLSIKSGAVTPGAFTVGGELTVGTTAGTWSIDASGTDIVFTKVGGSTATLLAPSVASEIAYKTDIPSTTGIFDVTGSSTQREATVTNFTLSTGAQLFLKFLSASTTSNTLRINSTGSYYPIFLNGGAITAGAISANGIVRTYFDGTNFIVLENFALRKYYGNANNVDGTVGVTHGGTGTSTAPTQWGVIYAASATGYASTSAPTKTGTLLRGVSGGVPVWSTPAFPNTATSGKFMYASGTDWGESTATIPTSAGAVAGKYLVSDGSNNYALSSYSLTLGGNTTINTSVANYVAYYSGTNALSGEQYLSVSRGGTGAGTFTDNAILVGNVTSAIQAPGPTLTATVLTFSGAGTINSTTTSALTLDSTSTGAINIGTNANAKTITIGNVTGATAVDIKTGTGNLDITSPLTTLSGQLTVGTSAQTWFIEANKTIGGETNLFAITSGAGATTPGQIYRLPAKVAGTYTLAVTSDIPAGVMTSDDVVSPSAPHYISFVDANNASPTIETLFTYATLSYVPETGVLTATEFSGLIDGGTSW